MPTEILIIALILIIVIGGLIGWRISRAKNAIRLSTHDLEIQGLNLLLQNQPQKALVVFRDIARRDTNNMRAYLQVADLYRELGQPKKSIEIHEDLLQRPNLSDQVRMMIYQSLGEDYEVLGEFEKALDYARSVLKLNKKDAWALQAKHDFHKALRHWQKAIYAFERLKTIKPDMDDRIPVCYKVEEAMDKLRAGDRPEAISLLKQAIKMDHPIPSAYFNLGKINQETGHLKHAIDYYTTFAELEPELGSLVFPEIEKMYFELGQFDSVEQFYTRLKARQPDSIDVAVGLASHLERKGELREALAIIDDALLHNQTSRRLSLMRIGLLQKLKQPDAFQMQISKMLETEYRENRLTCKNCGYSDDYPVYLCPKCGR